MLPAVSLLALAAVAGFGLADCDTSLGTVPSYVVEYAPIVYLYKEETFNPGDLQAQLDNTHPENANRTDVPNVPEPLTLDNLNDVNTLDTPNGTSIYLSSDDDFTLLPPWIHGVAPDSTGKTDGARSCAIVTNDRGNGTVDAFYFYFYSYNLGNHLFGETFGDHVGDWEHSMIRFENATPSYIWLSQHDFGDAFTFAAMPKLGKRPITYSANGSHANYATSGTHEHLIPDLPFAYGPLLDYTSETTLWDPTLSAYYFSSTFPASDGADNDSDPTFYPLTNPIDGTAPPVNWLYFQGQWGDEQLPASDPRQFQILNISVTYKYTSGPNGPQFKDINRPKVCPSGHPCIIHDSVVPGSGE